MAPRSKRCTAKVPKPPSVSKSGGRAQARVPGAKSPTTQKRKKKQQQKSKWTPKPLPIQPPAVKIARERIRAAISTGGDMAPSMIGLALAVLAQEIGSHKAANQLIKDFNLTGKYGIHEVETD